MTTSTIEVVPTGSACGAEILGIDLSQQLSGDAAFTILSAFRDHLVIFFRGQTLTGERLEEIGELFGPDYTPPEGIPMLGGESQGGLTRIGNVDGGVAGAGPIPHHSDLQYMPVPLLGSMLYAVEVPETGGDTAWSNLYAAYDDLSDEMKQRLAGVQGIGINPYTAAATGRSIAGENQKYVETSVPDFPHPLVRTHPETGRKSLYMSMFMQTLTGAGPDDVANELRDELNAHVDQDKYYYRHQWQAGDLVIWDNRCTNHKRYDFDPSARRDMWRVQIAGTRPF